MDKAAVGSICTFGLCGSRGILGTTGDTLGLELEFRQGGDSI